jgi:hypothetical protein
MKIFLIVYFLSGGGGIYRVDQWEMPSIEECDLRSRKIEAGWGGNSSGGFLAYCVYQNEPRKMFGP